MISALAKAGTILARDTYVKRATKAAEFVRQHLYDRQSGRLLRSCYRGQQQENVVSQKYVTFDFFLLSPHTQWRRCDWHSVEPIEGFLDDYSFVIRGLLDLYTACQDEKWIQWADELQQKQDELFWDSTLGGYFSSTADDSTILIRLKEGTQLPSVDLSIF